MCPYQMIDIEAACLEQTLACTFPHRKSWKAQGEDRKTAQKTNFLLLTKGEGLSH